MEAVDLPPPPSHDPSEPLTPAEMEALRQHLLANGRWLLGLGKAELRLLGKLTGYDIGGDLLSETPYLDYIKPDFGSSDNPLHNGYPGAPPDSTLTNNTDTPPTLSPSVISNSSNPSFAHPIFSSDIEDSSQTGVEGNKSQLSHQESLNDTVPFTPSITDPSDEDIVFKPLSTADNSSDSNGLNSEPPPSDASPPGDSHSNNEAPPTQRPTEDPLIYPVQFYSQSSLPQTKPSTDLASSGENFNPLANLAEKYPDNFMGW